MNKIPLIKPYITDEVKQEVCAVLDSGYLTEGSVTHELENMFSKYIGCTHSIAVTSCTTGLEIALRALNVGPGDEVIVPDYTYPATADVIAILGAKIVIVDVSPQTMLINCEEIKKAITPNTKAIIPVSLFGNPLDYNELELFRTKYGLKIVEDAACAIGAEYKGIKVGNWSDITVFSLHPRKFITTGEGGIITTNNVQMANWMNSYKHFGMATENTRESTVFNRIGTNYKLSNVLSAIGVVQMRHIKELLSRRRKLADIYRTLIGHDPRIGLPSITLGGEHSYQSFCVFIENRNEIMATLRNQGIEVQIGNYALHNQPAFTSKHYCRISGECKNSQLFFDNCLVLPLFHEMTEEDQSLVIRELKAML